MQHSKSFRIIWALDAFPEKKEDFTQAIQALKALSKMTAIEIIPTYIFNLTEFYGESERVIVNLPKNTLSELVTAARKTVESLLKPIKSITFRKPVIISHSNLTDSSNVLELEKFALKSKAALILLSTHGRKGMTRFLLGSFAESLILKTQIPTLIVNPKTKVSPNFKNILFSTDFSDESFQAFKIVCKLAKNLQGKIKIYHKLIDRISPVLAAGAPFLGGQYQVDPRSALKRKDTAKMKGEKYIKFAKKLKVTARLKLDDQGGSMSESIVKEAKTSNSNLLALISRSGRFSTTLIGSACRQVVRSAEVPVWIIHPAKRKTKSKRSLLKSRGKGSRIKPTILYS